MARDNFIGWSLDDKIAMLRGVQESMLTGQVLKIATSRGVETQFDPSQQFAEVTLAKLEYSIACDTTEKCVSDSDWAIRRACAKNRRTTQTRHIFR